jgi:ubiquinone/menaquinone biosynthesis C-methylase UbiE
VCIGNGEKEKTMAGFSQSRFAAKLQEKVSVRRYETGLYKEIAEKLPLQETGRVLDVGTGTGLQLRAIHEIRPGVSLHGLDLSGEAIELAKAYLADLDVDLRVGSIESTNFDDDTFDIVTCNSSMSYWKSLVGCFDEIYRILKPGGQAVLFEPRKNIDIDGALAIIRRNMADESPVRRFLAVNMNRFGLKWGRTLGLKLYSMEELERICRKSRFGDQVSITPETLLDIPIFMRVCLTK